MQLSRSAVIAWVVGAIGTLNLFGLDIDMGAIEASVTGIVETVYSVNLENAGELVPLIIEKTTGLVMVVWTAAQLWLRKITGSPMAQGIRGLLFRAPLTPRQKARQG